jgi:hypothetical protein
MKKLSHLLLTVALASLVLTGCKKSDDRKNYVQVGGTSYDLVLGDLEYYGPISEGYDIDMNLLTEGITLDNKGFTTGAGTWIWFELHSSESDGLPSGTYEFSPSTDTYQLLNAEHCLSWVFGEASTWISLDHSKAGYMKVVRDGSRYEVTFKGVDEEGNTVKGNFSGTFALYDFSSTKSGGSHK